MPNAVTTLRDSETTGVTGTSLESRPDSSDTSDLEQYPGVTGATSTGRSPGFKPNRASSAQPISIDVLYQAREAGSSHFNRALELLSHAADALSEARRAYSLNDQVGAASAVIAFEELLEPLFDCRAVGDGFANVINTIHFGIANLGQNPMTEVQVKTLWRIIRELATAPFLSFGESLKFVKDLKRVGLELNNQFITSWASESSGRDAESIP